MSTDFPLIPNLGMFWGKELLQNYNDKKEKISNNPQLSD